VRVVLGAAVVVVHVLWHQDLAVLLRRRGWCMAGTARHYGSRLAYLLRVVRSQEEVVVDLSACRND
jgi:hypothetical protein